MPFSSPHTPIPQLASLAGLEVLRRPRVLDYIVHDTGKVLRDEIGTAMTNINSRADQFSLIIHSQEGEGSPKRDSSRKEVQMYVGHTGVSQSDARISCASNGASLSNCQRKSLILGFQ